MSVGLSNFFFHGIYNSVQGPDFESQFPLHSSSLEETVFTNIMEQCQLPRPEAIGEIFIFLFGDTCYQTNDYIR